MRIVARRDALLLLQQHWERGRVPAFAR